MGEPIEVKESTEQSAAKRMINSLCDPHSSQNAIFVQQSAAVVIIYLYQIFYKDQARVCSNHTLISERFDLELLLSGAVTENLGRL